MNGIGLLLFLAVGGAAGWIAGNIMRGGGFGIVGNVIVGVIGALIGGFVLPLVGIHTAGLIGSLIAAVVGAVILLWVVGMLKRR